MEEKGKEAFLPVTRAAFPRSDLQGVLWVALSFAWLQLCLSFGYQRGAQRPKSQFFSPLPVERKPEMLFFHFPAAVLGLPLVHLASLVGLHPFCTVLASLSPSLRAASPSVILLWVPPGSCRTTRKPLVA